MTLTTELLEDGYYVVDLETETPKDGPYDFAEDAEIRWMNMVLEGISNGQSYNM